MNSTEGMNRVLDMVESGRISAGEGAALLESTQTFSGTEVTCPYCAESISTDSRICPECGSDLAAPFSAPQHAGSGFKSLTGLGKFLVIYTLLVSGQSLLQHFCSFDFAAAITVILSVLGLAAGVLILKSRPVGWKLGILWSALQIVPVIVQHQTVNQQYFHIGIKNQVNGMGLGFNLIGLILLIFFIKAKPPRP